jgi:putative cardiolipin synthase
MSALRRSILWLSLLGCWLAMAGCASPLPERSTSQFDPHTHDTRLGRAAQAAARHHDPGHSGVALLDQGRDAFAARVLLAEAAERTLDVQYYIWANDMSGQLLLGALRRAADRGVRVRLLLDDLGTSGLDGPLAELNAHPQVEVRLFNPFSTRRFKPLGFLTDFARANRRMHNKSFTADSQASVLGGRNVGDAYFGAEADTLFVDLDVMTIGPVVPQIAADFDRYWASPSAYPLSAVLGTPEADATPGPATPAALTMDALPASTRDYLSTVAHSPFVADLLRGELPMHWVPVELVSDDPAKGQGRAADEDLMFSRMARLMDRPARTLKLVSPYFVPTARGTALFSKLAAQGVQVDILTNALEATDVAVVHAGYMPWRKPLLQAGVQLYEMRRQPGAEHADKLRLGSSSAESLHAKTFVVDRQQVFVGSFNFDPRSARLNTEMGLVINSPALGSVLQDQLEAKATQRAYQLSLDPQGRLRWRDELSTPAQWHAHDPGTTLWQRAAVRALSWLPIDWLL